MWNGQNFGQSCGSLDSLSWCGEYGRVADAGCTDDVAGIPNISICRSLFLVNTITIFANDFNATNLTFFIAPNGNVIIIIIAFAFAKAFEAILIIFTLALHIHLIIVGFRACVFRLSLPLAMRKP